jgi:hypothetical protein
MLIKLSVNLKVIKLTPWSRVLPEKLKRPKLLVKFPAFYGTRRFITAFTTARPVPILSQIDTVYVPHPNSQGSILILFSIFAWVFQVVLFPQVSPVSPLCTSPLPHTCHMSCPSQSSWFDPRMIFVEEYSTQSCLLCSLLHSPATPSLLGPNILLSTLFSNVPSLHSSLNVSDQVSHPYKTTGKISYIYLNLYIFG